MDKQIEELLPFLHDGRIEVRQIAVSSIVGFTTKTSGVFHIFMKHSKTLAKDLMKLCKDDEVIVHDSIRSLINLSGEQSFCAELADTEFLKTIIYEHIISKTSKFTDLACMLLSNACKNDAVASKVLTLESKPIEELGTATTVLGQLAEVFLKGTDKGYNPQANYDYLASVFATVAALPLGRTQLFIKDQDGLAPLSKIVCFTEHESVIRRGGVITAIKNASFSVENHSALLDENDINVLPYILLPLCGPEEFDLDDMDGMPEDIQLLPPTKKRESDDHLRLTLLEGLILLTSTRPGRDYLREKKTYPVIQKMHQAETNENVQDCAEQIVNMLMRDEDREDREEKIKELGAAEEDDEEGITEV